MTRAGSKPRLLALGHGGAGTGFARGCEAILAGVADAFDTHLIALDLDGAAPSRPWTVHRVRDDDIYGVTRTAELVERLRPAIVLVYHNTWYYPMVAGVLETLRERLGFRIVLYLPIEGDLIAPEHARKLAGVDRLVTFTHTGRAAVETALRTADAEQVPALEAIPHGVDRGAFHPLSQCHGLADRTASRTMARERLFADRPDLTDAFIVFNGNRNQRHKRIDLTIEGFAAFAREKPDTVKLYLHMGRVDIGRDIVALAARNGIGDRLLTTGCTAAPVAVSDGHLNHLYNAVDVGVSTSMAEGWGLVSFEHAATGVPQIVPRHSAFAEIWEEAALYLTPRPGGERLPVSSSSVEVSPDDLAGHLEALYRDPGLREAAGLAAFRRTIRDDVQWSAIGARWRALLLAELEGGGLAETQDRLPVKRYGRASR